MEKAAILAAMKALEVSISTYTQNFRQFLGDFDSKLAKLTNTSPSPSLTHPPQPITPTNPTFDELLKNLEMALSASAISKTDAGFVAPTETVLMIEMLPETESFPASDELDNAGCRSVLPTLFCPPLLRNREIYPQLPRGESECLFPPLWNIIVCRDKSEEHAYTPALCPPTPAPPWCLPIHRIGPNLRLFTERAIFTWIEEPPGNELLEVARGGFSGTKCAFQSDVVTEFIEGVVETYPGLQYLDSFPDVKVVLCADGSGATNDKVAHEPAHAGFVGEWMLTAAICGDVFASPHVDSILVGIRAVTGPSGCFLIVKNYIGDCLNFGLAAEHKSEGYKVEMVVVGGDCTLPPPKGIPGRRGLAGTILIRKIAGAAAASGLSLEDVAAEAKWVSDMVGTMGVALSVCKSSGQVTPDRLGPGKMELGLGIHGEPGAAVADLQPVDIVVSHVLKQILSTETNYVPITCGNRVVLRINGLGATPLMIAVGKAFPRLQLEHGLAVERVSTGSFVTSLDMAGFSITVMKADQTILSRLDAPTKAPNWPVAVDGNHPCAKIYVHVPRSHSKKNDETFDPPKQLSPMGHILEVAIEAAVTEIVNLKDNLNEWDNNVGDGDCGSTMSKGASAILEDMKKCYPLNDPAETYYNAGGNVKFGFSMAFTTTMLSWSVIELEGLMKEEIQHARKAIKWANDSLLKATAPLDIIFVKVGDVAASLVFQKIDPNYSKILARREIPVFEFSDKHHGAYGIVLRPYDCPYCCDFSGYQEELLWGAAWLHRAPRNLAYFSYIQTNGQPLGVDESDYKFGWDHANVMVKNGVPTLGPFLIPRCSMLLSKMLFLHKLCSNHHLEDKVVLKALRMIHFSVQWTTTSDPDDLQQPKGSDPAPIQIYQQPMKNNPIQ